MNKYKITKEQWNEMIKGLKEFMEDRKLTPEMQRLGFLRNIVEELGEYAEAKTNTYMQIDAICDICVFALNTIDDPTNEELEIPAHNPSLSLLDIVLKVHTLGNFVGMKEMIIQVVKDLFRHLVSIGFDPLKCMMETIKEIKSRKGYWDESINKFVKYKGCYGASYLGEYRVSVIDQDEEDVIYEHCELEEEDDCYKLKHKDSTKETVLAKWYQARYDTCELSNN